MAELPKFHEFMRPLLEVLVENGEMHRHDAVAATIEKVGLTEEQKSIFKHGIFFYGYNFLIASCCSCFFISSAS